MDEEAEAEAAFRALIARNQAALGRIARHYEASTETRRDLEQDILVALWRAMPSFRGDASERTWVYRVAHNVAATHVARAMRKKRDDAAMALTPPSPPESTPSPLDLVTKRDAMRQLDARIRELDLASRQLVLLALEGFSMGEIADVTGLSLTNVTTRLSRLKKELASS